MKMYMLLMLMAMFVGFSYVPLRAPAKPREPTAPDLWQPDAQQMSSGRI